MIFRLVRHLLRSPAFWLGSTLLLAGIATNLTASDVLDKSSSNGVSDAQSMVMREGTRIESRVCTCQSDGDRLAITFKGKAARSLIALENLAAQRILNAVLDDPSDQHWVISANITEFRGSNFVLLERVARVSK